MDRLRSCGCFGERVITAWLATALVLGIAIRALGWLGPMGALVIGVSATCTVLCAASARKRPALWFLAALCGAGCWGSQLAPAHETPPLAQPPNEGLARILIGVGRGGCSQRGCWCEATLLHCTALEPESCAPPGERIGVHSERELPLGARVTALAKLKLRATFRNPSKAVLWPDVRPRIQAKLDAAASPRVDGISWLDARLAHARSALRHALDGSLAAPHAGIARALLLGEGGAVDDELNESIRNAGVSHVLAVSGMHVTLLVGALVSFVRLVWLRTPLALLWEARRAAAALGVLLAPLVARLCGAAPSAVRAAWTSTLMYLVIALGLRPSALAVSALVMSAHAICSPHDALHPGFVLSVLATAALLTQRRTGGGVLGALLESTRAWLATTPFLLLCFGQSSLISILANVALLPIGAALVPLAAGHAGVALSALHTELPTGACFELASGAFVEAARIFSSLDPGLQVPPLTALEEIAACALCASLMLPVRLRSRALLAGAAALVIVPSEWALRRSPATDELIVTFLDVGQGDSALIESGRGHIALIDAGGSMGRGPDPGQYAVLPALRARRITRLEVVVLSHPHPDHYGGLRAVIDAVPVAELWDTGQAEAEGSGGEAARLLAYAREHGVRVRNPADLCRAPQQLGGARLRVFAPCPHHDDLLGANDNSFVIRLEHGQRSFLFTGDVEHEAEAKLVAGRAALESDVLKVAHHGSRTSSSAPLLARVRPWLAVVSAGRANRFGHPHGEVLERLGGAVAHVLRTDLHGGVSVLSDGHTLAVSAWDSEVNLRLPAAARDDDATNSLPEARHHEADAGDGAQHEHGARQLQRAR